MVGSAAVLLRGATYGIGVTNDANLYISTARSLVEGQGLTTWAGLPYSAPHSEAAPLYPIILAISSLLTGRDAIEVAGYVNALQVGLIAFTVAMWLRTFIKSKFLVIWAACACALNLSIAEISAHVSTETTFILCCVISLLALNKHMSTQKRSWLILAAVSAAAALLTRYIGITLVGSGLAVICLQKHTMRRTKLTNATIWTVIVSSPLSLWMVRNMVVAPPFEAIVGEPFSWYSSLRNAIIEIMSWVGPTSFITVGIWFLLLMQCGSIKYDSRVWEKNGYIVTILIGWASIYTILSLLFGPLTGVDIPPRFWTPLVPIWVIIITLVLDDLISRKSILNLRFNDRLSSLICGKTCIISVLTICLLLWIELNYDFVRAWNSEESGIRRKQATPVEVIGHINDHDSYRYICSNNPLPLYLNTDHHKVQYKLIPDELEAARSYVLSNCSGSDDLVVSLFSGHFPHFKSMSFTLAELGAALGMEVVAVFADGAVLKATGSVVWGDDFLVRSLFEGVRLVVDSHFEVHVDHRLNRLIYVRRSRCGFNDIAPEFIVHAFPVDEADLPSQRQQYAFDDLSFYFPDHANFGDQEALLFNVEAEYCIAVRSLPDYNIAAIRTGQIRGSGDSWMGEFTLN